jgi:hypothetical protein
MISGYVDISNVIYEACERLGISNSEAYEMRFMRLILDAEMKIGTGMITAKKVVLYQPGSDRFLDGKRLNVPPELVDSLCIYDSYKMAIPRNCYDVIGKRIIFSNTQTTPIILTYNGIEFDINDQPVISQSHKEAVVSYLVYMETTTRYHSKKAAHYEFVDSREWFQDRMGEARGDDAFPTFNDIKEGAGALFAVKMYLIGGEVPCKDGDVEDVLNDYNRTNNIYYGSLDLSSPLIIASDYTSSLLTNEIETTLDNLSSGSFYFNNTIVSRFTLVLPYDSGLINSMLDDANNDIFDGYFNIIKDEVKRLTIYTAKDFVSAGNYKLTFGFSN